MFLKADAISVRAADGASACKKFCVIKRQNKIKKLSGNQNSGFVRKLFYFIQGDCGIFDSLYFYTNVKGIGIDCSDIAYGIGITDDIGFGSKEA